MRIPRARLGSQFSVVVLALLVVSTLSARADNAVDNRPTSPSARTQHLVLTPANLRFGKVGIGRRSIRAITIANWGDSSITLSQVITKGRDFTISGLDLPLTLARGESFTFSGVFAPRSRGKVHGSISFVSDASNTANPTGLLALTGTGDDDADQLTVTPVLMDFGDVLVGSYANQTGKLTASGDSLTILSANSSSPEFTLSGLPLPLTIPAGESVQYTVTFTPDDTGAVFASLNFVYDGGSSMAVQSLTGIGDVANSHSVDLSWNASTSLNVIGYNVYRKTSGGHYRKINSVLIASTVYTDTSVVDGYTYYYVATAVNSSDQESAYSNQAQATIPTAHPRILGYTRSPAFSRKMPMTGALSGRH